MMWQRFLPEISARVDLLEAASQAHAAGTLSDDLCSQAHSAAHKLAGSLGMFGRMQATEHARALELALVQASVSISPADFQAHVDVLRACLTEN
jgi:HPt (histidine-containing phosphotransfer) domain-containing protein